MAAKFNIAVVTTSRADYGIYASLLKELEASAKVDLSINRRRYAPRAAIWHDRRDDRKGWL